MLELVPEFDDMEPASVYVEVDVALFKVRGNGFPDLDLRMPRFNRLPGRLSDALAVDLRQNEKQLQLAFGRVFVYAQDYAAHLLTVQDNPVSLRILSVDGIFDSLSGDDLLAFLATFVPLPELLLGTILERPLVVPDELLPVIGLQGKECNLW